MANVGDPSAAGTAAMVEEPDDMPWVRLDDSLFRSPAFAGLPDDSARLAYLAIATAGSETSPPGEWPSRAVMVATMPGWVARRIPTLIDAGVLDETSDRLRVRDRSFYPSETPGAIRTARSRGRHADRYGNDTDPVTPSLSSSLRERDNAASRAGAHEAEWDAAALDVEALTGRPYALVPFSKLGDRVGDMIAKHGLDRVREAMARAARESGPMPTVAQVVLGAGNALDVIPRVRPDCPTCYNLGVTSKGRSPCPDCGRREADPGVLGSRAH